MNCAQRILYNGINAARTAALIASSVRPAVDSIRTLPTARDGSAAVALSGAYTGAADAAFDVEIVDTTVSTPIVSQPQFVGTGNGELSAIAFSGTAQGFTLELADAGAEEAYAAVPFANAKITARAAASGRRAHHRCKVLGWPWRIDFSRAAAALIASNGKLVSMSFFGVLMG